MPFLVIPQSPTYQTRTTLLTIKQQWGNPSQLSSWNTSSPPCSWPEITCTNDTVTGLNFTNYNITESIPPSICDLKNLTMLDLSYNCFLGYFPTILYNCSSLQYLDLSQNYFVGPIPSNVDRLSSSLRYIDVGANSFSGDIPQAIGRLPELRFLKLYMNQFNGSFPAEIGNLSNLEDLSMAYNPLFTPAKIPPEFGKLKKLTFLWITQANLIGEIPGNFSGLSSLEWLDLSSNDLEGPFPKALFQLKNLSVAYLYSNRLTGGIPTPIQSLNLTLIDLSNNNLSGSIPEDFGKLQQLELLHLHFNLFSGENNMEDAAILLCRRADKTIAIILSQNLDFESLVSRLSHKWKDLTQGCFEISYTLDGHPNCDVDCDEDLIALRTLAKKFRIGRIDVIIHDLIGSNTSLNVGECGDGSSSSLNVGGSGELIFEIDNGSEMTLSLFDQERNQLKSDAWRFAIKGVDQVFIGGAFAFHDSLSKYSLVHGFEYIYAKNDAETVKARCRTLHCTWFVKAKVEKPSGLFRIKELMNEHSCGAASLSTSSSRSSPNIVNFMIPSTVNFV
ncbi:hypothetical protein RHSIM_Rhsim01G0083700 [Rhododendron simsii]|uniref:Transposase MuDR plant domain-containing protein n=1 Tax=Rhododendron simsii TaxID=118357 RepID=A0A834HEW1_RHOSS|nr:hypothetical protein RHSIM_Rhsim01G0083700 [Rhododendron simsii]